MTDCNFQAELWLPHPRDEIFSFFADAHNLQAITPPWLHFHVLTPSPFEMKVGGRIDYQLRVHGLPFRWQSEITVWEPPHRFVDEQRRGPYRRWIHDHRFLERDGGTLCLGGLRYAVPGGWLLERLFVRRDVDRIFAFRQERLAQIFGAD